jgi:hypothetical protein
MSIWLHKQKTQTNCRWNHVIGKCMQFLFQDDPIS